MNDSNDAPPPLRTISTVTPKPTDAQLIGELERLLDERKPSPAQIRRMLTWLADRQLEMAAQASGPAPGCGDTLGMIYGEPLGQVPPGWQPRGPRLPGRVGRPWGPHGPGCTCPPEPPLRG